LRELRVPTLVIHGVIDPLVGVSGGRRTAELIPGAELVEFDDMGHDLPPALFPQIIDAIVRHTSKVGSTTS
jgi:pimeloyl-ACP methyl ester carboxylesterase